MTHFSKLIRQGHGLAPVLLKRAASITLDWDVRQKSRFESTDSADRQVGVFLQRGQVVRGGDVLVSLVCRRVGFLFFPDAVKFTLHTPSRRSVIICDQLFHDFNHIFGFVFH
jgi:urease accessory protein